MRPYMATVMLATKYGHSIQNKNAPRVGNRLRIQLDLAVIRERKLRVLEDETRCSVVCEV